MLSDTQQFQLEFLHDISEISDICSIKTWVWGGFAIDIHEGRFLREHHDLDCFTLNLLDIRYDMEDRFVRKSYTVTWMDEVDMLQVRKNGCEAAFNRLEIEDGTAMWRHIGNEGTVFFPAAWLSATPHDFYGTGMLISGAEFEYSIKANVRLLSPVWESREKDHTAMAYWSKVLKKRNIDPESLLRDIRSDNPYWKKRGYTG